MLAQLGFKALATTSSGFAWSMGRADNGVSLEQALAHFRAIADSVDVPVNGDFEGGFAIDPADVAKNVAARRRDWSGRTLDRGLDRQSGGTALRLSARCRADQSRPQALDESGTGVLLTGRSEGFIAGRPDLAETIRRLTAYAEAGADCLYAPGIRSSADISAVIAAVAPRPVNVLVSSDFATVADLAKLGVRRISVGGALARTAWHGFLQAATEIAELGTFRGLARGVPSAEINGRFQSDPGERLSSR